MQHSRCRVRRSMACLLVPAGYSCVALGVPFFYSVPAFICFLRGRWSKTNFFGTPARHKRHTPALSRADTGTARGVAGTKDCSDGCSTNLPVP